MTHDEQISILHKANATRGELREALAAALGNSPPLEKTGKAATTADRIAAREYWCEVYKQRNNGALYYWSSKDAGALSQLLNKIAEVCEKPADVIWAFQALVQKLPRWYIENQYSVAVVNSKFNEITAAIRKTNENGIKQHTGVSNDYLARLARQANQ